MAATKLKSFFLALLSMSALWADQVTLKNGDRVTGAIVKKDGDTLTIKTDLMGEVSVKWDQVESVRSDAPLNVVVGDKTVQSTLATSGGEVELKEQGTRVPPASVVAIRNAEEQRAYERLQDPGLRDLWAGAIAIGFAGTSGNAQTRTFTTAFDAARITRNDKTSVYFKMIRSSALLEGVKADTAEAARGGWAYNHVISPRVFVNVFNDYEYDRFQNLDLRFVLGGGLGYIVWTGERGRLDLLAGVAYNREKFGALGEVPAFTRNSAEAYWGDDLNYKLTSVTTLLQSFRMFNNLSNTGEYRMNFDLSANTQIARWLTWTLGISDRYLSNPVPGRKTNDFLYTTGLGITFAR
jgi:putative salt-induced outer membrane protein YdiY